MRAPYRSYFQSTHPLLSNWLSLEAHLEDIYVRMVELDQIRDKALDMLPNPRPNDRQRRALEILQRQQELENRYMQRCEALLQAGLPAQQQDWLTRELHQELRRAWAELMQDWPELNSSEIDALPLLLMRRNVSSEIDQRLETLKIELSCQG